MNTSITYLVVPTLLVLACANAAETPPIIHHGEAPPVVETEEPLGKRLLDQDFYRMPPMALRAMADVMSGTLGDDVAERFSTDVQAGAWQAMRAILDKLPPEEATKVYDHVLQRLVKHEASLLPGEVIDLAEVAPGVFSSTRMAMLGNILKNSIDLVSATGSLVARLETGTAHFGGKDPANRGRAAAILLAANRVIEAGSFLPPLDAALASRDDLTLDLHAQFLFAIGRERKQPANLLKAWELSATILQRSDSLPALAEVRSRTIGRCLALLSDVPTAIGDSWLRSVFTHRIDLSQAILAEISTKVTLSQESKDEDQRREALVVQHRLVTVLIDASGSHSDRWRTSLDLLTLGWLNEATLAALPDDDDSGSNNGVERYIREQMRHQNPPANQLQSYRQYYRKQYYQNRGNNGRRDNNDIQPLPVDILLASAPTPAWLALLDSSLAQRLRSLVGEFVCRGEDRERALALIQDLASDEPQRASRLTRSLVRAFSQSLEANDNDDDRSNSGSGIPLTRARQTRNLNRLATLLAKIAALPVKPVPPADIVQAFIACHSPAEVFRSDDITKVLGDPRTLTAGVLVELVSAMRSRLADAWRKPSVQQQAGTQRSDAEVVAEVERGYELAKTLCTRTIMLYPLAWELIQVKSALDFDHGEFVYGQQAPLATYTALRDTAFAGYADAARAYEFALTGEQKPDVSVYMQWFAAALGASDLSYLSRQQEADGDQVTAVRDAIAALPEPSATGHIELFAHQIVSSLGDINAELKPRYLRHALRIIGNSPLAAEVATIVADYDELLSEVQLDLCVDGATTVGHQQPFGTRLSLRHTTALGRESGGFAKYLENQVQGSGGQEVNYRNDLEKHLRETLGEHFSVESITFHTPDVASHGYGRDGWRELPLAYIVLKAKDASVDRLPSVHIDLDFIDGHGAVILPVSSGMTLIDARTTPSPPLATVTGIDLTLDDRELSAGTLRLEIRASGKGLIGSLETLLNPQVAGFTITQQDDHGPTVTSMDVDGAQVRPIGERLWQIRYSPESTAIPIQFTFPSIATSGITIKRQRYHDADLLDAAVIESLSPRQPWSVRLRPWLVVLGAALVFGAVTWLARRARKSRRPILPRHVLPRQFTPFTVLTALRAVYDDTESGLDASRRSALAAAINELEQRSFGRDGQSPDESALALLARTWITTPA